jgi:K+-transporting ATPase c subunit
MRKLISGHQDSRQFGLLGEETINVVDLNLALDDLHLH